MYVSANTDHAVFNADQAAFVTALDQAHARSFHSYFTQYVLVDEDAGYVAVPGGWRSPAWIAVERHVVAA